MKAEVFVDPFEEAAEIVRKERETAAAKNGQTGKKNRGKTTQFKTVFGLMSNKKNCVFMRCYDYSDVNY